MGRRRTPQGQRLRLDAFVEGESSRVSHQQGRKAGRAWASEQFEAKQEVRRFVLFTSLAPLRALGELLKELHTPLSIRLFARTLPQTASTDAGSSSRPDPFSRSSPTKLLTNRWLASLCMATRPGSARRANSPVPFELSSLSLLPPPPCSSLRHSPFLLQSCVTSLVSPCCPLLTSCGCSYRRSFPHAAHYAACNTAQGSLSSPDRFDRIRACLGTAEAAQNGFVARTSEGAFDPFASLDALDHQARLSSRYSCRCD